MNWEEEASKAMMLSYPHIEKPRGEPARLERVPRVRVAQIVMDYLTHGWSPDEMCRQHPYLRPAEAHAAMAYYFDHQDEIDREIEAEWQHVQHDRTRTARSPFYLRLKARGVFGVPVLLFMDVHVPQPITDQLRRRGADVLTAIEDGWSERDDDELLEHAHALGRVLFTQDTRFKALAED